MPLIPPLQGFESLRRDPQRIGDRNPDPPRSYVQPQNPSGSRLQILIHGPIICVIPDIPSSRLVLPKYAFLRGFAASLRALRGSSP